MSPGLDRRLLFGLGGAKVLVHVFTTVSPGRSWWRSRCSWRGGSGLAGLAVLAAPIYLGSDSILLMNAFECVNCHAPGKARPQSPLTTHTEVYTWRSQIRLGLIPGGSMRQYLRTGESEIVVGWIDTGAPETH